MERTDSQEPIKLVKKKSEMHIHMNPLDTGSIHKIELKVENISEAVLISPEQLNTLLNKLRPVDDNAARLNILADFKVPFLFSSDDLLKIIDITTSIKTKINMIASIGPRLIDPKAKTAQFLSIFRYAEEKSQVEEILKARAQNLNATLFTKSDSTARMVGRGGRGPGGRSSFMGGRGGRGTSKANLEHTDSTFTPKSRHFTASVDSDDGRDLVTSGVDNVFSVLDQLEGQNKGHQTSKYNFSASQSVINLDTITEDEPEDPINSTGLQKIEVRPENSSPVTDLELSTTNSSPSIPTSHEFVKQEPAPFVEERVLFHTKSENEIIHVKSVTVSNLDKLFEEIPSTEEESSHDSNPGSAQGSCYNIQPSFNPPQKSASAANVLSTVTFDVNDRPAPNTVKRFTQIFSTKPSSNTNNIKTTEHLDDLKSVRMIRSRRHSEFTYPSQSTVPQVAVATTSHRASLNIGQDLASKCALALYMTKEEFLCLDRHEPVRVVDGIPKFTYRELVRRNYIKDYGELAQNELEKHLVDEEFNPVFGRDKEQFSAQVKWKQIEQKKKAMLF